MGTEYPVQDSPAALTSADVNRDGWPDLVAVNAGSNSVSVLLNRGPAGPGDFYPAMQYGLPAGAGYAIVADFNTDNWPDLAVTDPATHAVCILLNLQDGTYGPVSSYPLAASPTSCAAADLDGDSFLDLVTTNLSFTSNIGILKGKGDGTFHPDQPLTINTDPNSFGGYNFPFRLALADFDNRNGPDLLVADSWFGHIFVALNDGHGSFGSPSNMRVTGGYPKGLVCADLNHDNKMDVVVASEYGTPVLLGNGDGTFSGSIAEPSHAFGRSLAIEGADWNADGELDLLLAADNVWSVVLGRGDGTFQPGPSATCCADIAALVARDFSKDGTLDLATALPEEDRVHVRLTEQVTLDTTPPVITLHIPSDPVLLEVEFCGGAMLYYSATATDDLDPCPALSFNFPPGTFLPEGTHQVICTAVDSGGNATQVQFTVIVGDHLAPTINAPSNMTVTQTAPEGAIVNFSIAVTDLGDPNPTVMISHPSGSLFPLGTTLVSITATDNKGNTANTSFTITVLKSSGSPNASVAQSWPIPQRGVPRPIYVTCGRSGLGIVNNVQLTNRLSAVIDPALVSVDSGGLPFTISGRDIVFQMGDLPELAQHTLVITATVPASVPLGSMVTNEVFLTALNDSQSADNASSLSVPVVAAIDPNDMSVSPGPLIKGDEILTYTVQYENIGQVETGLGVFVTNVLDPRFDLATLDPNAITGASGHPEFNPATRTLRWVDHTPLQPHQTRFFTYRLKLLPSLPPGTRIPNFASIVFDVEDPMDTPVASVEIAFPQALDFQEAARQAHQIADRFLAIRPVPQNLESFLSHLKTAATRLTWAAEALQQGHTALALNLVGAAGNVLAALRSEIRATEGTLLPTGEATVLLGLVERLEQRLEEWR